MDFENVIKERYSVRKFLDKPVEEDKIKKIMEACMMAPTAKNKQPIKIFGSCRICAKENPIFSVIWR